MNPCQEREKKWIRYPLVSFSNFWKKSPLLRIYINKQQNHQDKSEQNNKLIVFLTVYELCVSSDHQGWCLNGLWVTPMRFDMY